MEDADFNAAIKSAFEAIEANIYPALIPNGSSGMYFTKNHI